MNSETYDIKVVFEVAASSHNFNRGNLYLQAQFNSYKQTEESRLIAASGYLQPLGSVAIFVSDIIGVLPFGNYLLSPWCLSTQEVEIELFSIFDNKDFAVKSVDFVLANDTIQYKHCKIVVTTVLDGYRHFMHHWFWTSLFTAIIGTSLISSAFLCVCLCGCKRLNGFLVWL